MSHDKSAAARVKDATRSRTRGRAKRKWQVRENVAAPRSSFEELEIHASDGAVLRALVDDPPEGVGLRGTLVLSHAMFARKSSFGRRDRPGLSSALGARGFRTVAFDFRGHGDSKAPANEWGYDDLVRQDLPAVVDCARARGEDKPVIVVGHSLGGHVALAAQGTAHVAADAIVALGASVWLRELERSRLRWAAKSALALAVLAIAARAGGIPARRLRIGSDDAPELYLRDLLRVVTQREWRSRDGSDDYLASLALVKAPVAAVLGAHDLLTCPPSSGEAFARRCSGPVAVFRAPVGHMDLVTSARARPAVIDAVEWAFAQLRP
jgi:predicted alpha/beta hydrolase